MSIPIIPMREKRVNEPTMFTMNVMKNEKNEKKLSVSLSNFMVVTSLIVSFMNSENFIVSLHQNQRINWCPRFCIST
jgi:hypothetical protein